MYTMARIASRIVPESACLSAPLVRWAVAPWASTTGFSFGAAVPLPTSGEIPIGSVKVGPGQGLFVCAVLSVYSTDNRSCIDGCLSVGDPNSFWGDTGPSGTVIVPPVLESLSVSPTAAEAVAWGNDKIRLMIEAQ